MNVAFGATIPMAKRRIIPASTGMRNPGSRAINRRPASAMGRCEVPPRPNSLPIMIRSAAEQTNVPASTAKSGAGEAPTPRNGAPEQGPEGVTSGTGCRDQRVCAMDVCRRQDRRVKVLRRQDRGRITTLSCSFGSVRAAANIADVVGLRLESPGRAT